jgi:hypothetical protein
VTDDRRSATTLGEHIIIATKDERLLCITWQGELLLQRNLRDIDIVPLSPDQSDDASLTSSGASLTSSSADVIKKASTSSGVTAPASRKSSLDGGGASGAGAHMGKLGGVGAYAYGVLQLATSLPLRAIALVLSDGRVALLRFDTVMPAISSLAVASGAPQTPAPTPTSATASGALAAVAIATARGTWLRSLDATCVAFNTRHKLLAIGCARLPFCMRACIACALTRFLLSSSNVRIVDCDATRPATYLRTLRAFSLQPWSIKRDGTRAAYEFVVPSVCDATSQWWVK